MKPITNTFVLVATDCPTTTAVVPSADKPTVAAIEYELLTTKPYTLTLEELIFAKHVRRLGLSKTEIKSQSSAIRAELFAKSHACMRASPLPKRFGWGVHHDAQGRIALYAVESPEYRRLAADAGLAVVPAMRTSRMRG